MRRRVWAVLLLVGGLVGCATSPEDAKVTWIYPPLAEPLQPSFQKQSQLVHIEELLKREDLDNTTRAQIHFERGMIRDSLGLGALAVQDFVSSLEYKPDQADVFNILGVYYTQAHNFGAAYDAFDSALELRPNHPFAQRNMGIALYYGQRYRLAQKDLTAHYQDDINDPYRVIWLYLTELELDPEMAHANLRARVDMSDKRLWGWNIAAFYLGEISEQQLFESLSIAESNQQLAEMLCESYFYIAKRYAKHGYQSEAEELFKLAMAGNVYEYVEHRYSQMELAMMRMGTQ
uniref:lipoprotein NlpI n=1 Tax=Thaumasiovibrio occultus TaxID=1891184 RepID=UPI000B3568EB|nr:lipoprotein NlpI [Thaumasiovibrio occultus]